MDKRLWVRGRFRRQPYIKPFEVLGSFKEEVHRLEEGLECTCEVRVELMVVIWLEEVFRVLGEVLEECGCREGTCPMRGGEIQGGVLHREL